jgi:hypothetical protein
MEASFPPLHVTSICVSLSRMAAGSSIEIFSDAVQALASETVTA